MKRLRDHPVLMTVVAFVLAVAAVAALAIINGFSEFRHAWSHLHVGWLGLVVVAEVLAIPAYAGLYRKVTELEGGPDTPFPLLLRLVIAGFGPFAPDGGFALDKRALHALEEDEHSATIRVLGLGALEWALLAPATWVAAVVLLATGDPRPMPSLLWPWVDRGSDRLRDRSVARGAGAQRPHHRGRRRLAPAARQGAAWRGRPPHARA